MKKNCVFATRKFRRELRRGTRIWASARIFFLLFCAIRTHDVHLTRCVGWKVGWVALLRVESTVWWAEWQQPAKAHIIKAGKSFFRSLSFAERWHAMSWEWRLSLSVWERECIYFSYFDSENTFHPAIAFAFAAATRDPHTALLPHRRFDLSGTEPFQSHNNIHPKKNTQRPENCVFTLFWVLTFTTAASPTLFILSTLPLHPHFSHLHSLTSLFSAAAVMKKKKVFPPSLFMMWCGIVGRVRKNEYIVQNGVAGGWCRWRMRGYGCYESAAASLMRCCSLLA